MISLAIVFQLAVKHIADNPAMESSARLALADARKLEGMGALADARERATASLRFSVGVFHADYVRVFDGSK